MNKGKYVLAAALAAFVACSPLPDMIRVTGRVTDFDGRPMPGVTVTWQNPCFDGGCGTRTDSAGRYCVQVPKGRYMQMEALDLDRMPMDGSPFAEEEQSVGFHAWNFLAQRDTVLDVRCGRVEVNDVNAFLLQTDTRTYVLYCRPQSLTRLQQWERAGRPVAMPLAPPVDSARIGVEVNGVPRTILKRMQADGFADYGNAPEGYLLFVERPTCDLPDEPICFRITIGDPNGDRGEAYYTFEEKKYLWPTGDTDVTNK